MLRLATLLLAALLLIAPHLSSHQGGVSAQMFQNFFGGNQGGMFGQREQEAPPAGDARWFQERVEAAQCTQYLCPRTLSCVAKPSHCPCPFPQQIRCPYRDTDAETQQLSKKAGAKAAMELGGSVCVTATSCLEVEALLHAKN